MSSSFSTNFGSRDTLKLLTRCGLRPLARHTLSTEVSEMPSRAASLRVLQWVAPSGFVCVVTRTISAASIVGLRPRPGRSPRNPRNATGHKTIAPGNDLPATDSQASGNVMIARTIGRQQYNPGPTHTAGIQCLRSHAALQFNSLFIGQHDRGRLPHHSLQKKGYAYDKRQALKVQTIRKHYTSSIAPAATAGAKLQERFMLRIA
jgi:hypothetical protein